MPHPIGVPFRPPDTPCCIGLGFSAGNAAGRPASHCIGGFRVGRVVAGEIYHLCPNGALAQRTFVSADIDGNVLRLRRCMPLYPGNLTISRWNHNIVHPVGAAVDTKGYRSRAIRIDLRSRIERYRRDDICIHTILVVIVGWLRLFGRVGKPYNTHTQIGDNSIVGTGLIGSPCISRKSHIRIFQEHSQRQVFMGQTRHGLTQGPACLIIIERGFMGSHGHHNSVVLEIGDWLQKQLVLSANQFLVCDSGLLCHQFYRILGAEVFLDCFNAGLLAATADDPRHRGCGGVVVVIPRGWRNTCPIRILNFTDFPKMNLDRWSFISQIKRGRHRLTGFCINHSNSYTIHTRVPGVLRGSLPHIAATAIHVSASSGFCQGAHRTDTQQQHKCEQYYKYPLQKRTSNQIS